MRTTSTSAFVHSFTASPPFETSLTTSMSFWADKILSTPWRNNVSSSASRTRTFDINSSNRLLSRSLPLLNNTISLAFRVPISKKWFCRGELALEHARQGFTVTAIDYPPNASNLRVRWAQARFRKRVSTFLAVGDGEPWIVRQSGMAVCGRRGLRCSPDAPNEHDEPYASRLVPEFGRVSGEFRSRDRSHSMLPASARSLDGTRGPTCRSAGRVSCSRRLRNMFGRVLGSRQRKRQIFQHGVGPDSGIRRLVRSRCLCAKARCRGVKQQDQPDRRPGNHDFCSCFRRAAKINLGGLAKSLELAIRAPGRRPIQKPCAIKEPEQ